MYNYKGSKEHLENLKKARIKSAESRKGKPRSKKVKEKISSKLKGRHISPKTEFKKGCIPHNFKNGKKLKRKFKRFKGKLVLRSHYVWLKHHNLDKIQKEYVIHHKDGDSLNDNIDNLCLMKLTEHARMHNSNSGELK